MPARSSSPRAMDASSVSSMPPWPIASRQIWCSQAARAGSRPRDLEELWRALAAAGLERSDRVLAVGGGAVTDVVGFAAATFRRGHPLDRSSDDARRTGRRGDRRQDGDRRRRQERRRCVLDASGGARGSGIARHAARGGVGGRLRRVREDGAARRWAPLGARARAAHDAPAARAPDRARAALRGLQDARRRRGPPRVRSPRDPQPRSHHRPWRRGRGGLRGRCATARRSRSAWWRRCASRRGSRASTSRSRTRSPSCSPSTVSRARRRASRPTTCSPRCATTRSAHAGAHRFVLLEGVGRPVRDVEVPEALLAEVGGGRRRGRRVGSAPCTCMF